MANHSITVYNFGRFDNKLVALNKKAHKFGLPEISIDNVQVENKFVRNAWGEAVEVFSHYLVELFVPDAAFKLAEDWQLVGVIDHSENLTKAVPGAKQHDLRLFADRGSVCDHCHAERNRKETFVIERTDQPGYGLRQVGRQCLADYLGISPERALGQIEVVRELLDEEDWQGDRQILGFHLGFFLQHAAALIRTDGWRSRTTAREQGRSATADLVFTNIHNERDKRKGNHGEPLWVDRIAEDKALAEKVKAWVLALNDRTDLDNYLANLAQIGQNDYVTTKSSGFAASAIVAYQKEIEQEIKRAAKRKESAGYVGTVGKREHFVATLVRSHGFENEWGVQFIHKFIDAEGHILVWKTATELTDGKYALRATVKAHEEYAKTGELQTVITRAIFSKLEE